MMFPTVLEKEFGGNAKKDIAGGLMFRHVQTEPNALIVPAGL